MAERANPLIVRSALLSFSDYTGSPNTHVVGAVEVSSIVAIIEAAARVKEWIYTNSSSGGSLYAGIDGGESAPKEFAPKIVLRDPKNQTDGTTRELLTGLYNNSVTSQTGFSSWTVTSPLAGGGPNTVKAVLAIKDNGGTTHTATFAVCCTDTGAEASGEHFSESPKFAIIGAIVWS